MAVRGRARAQEKNHNPTLYIYIVISPLTIHFYIIDSCLGHILESTKGIEIETSFITRHHPTLYITKLSPINHGYHNGCLSWPYLGKGLKLNLVHS